MGPVRTHVGIRKEEKNFKRKEDPYNLYQNITAAKCRWNTFQTRRKKTEISEQDSVCCLKISTKSIVMLQTHAVICKISGMHLYLLFVRISDNGFEFVV